MCLYSNNEPLLDPRIVDFVGVARERLPKAKLFLYSNGILLTKELFLRLIPLLDNFTINNYCEDFRLRPNIAEIYALTEANLELAGKTSIVVRFRRELMTSRDGQAPNKRDILPHTLPVGCLLPARQLIVRPDGKVSLCCNDALGTMTLGDLSRERLTEVWWSEQNSQLRRCVLDSRGALDLCRCCDTLHF